MPTPPRQQVIPQLVDSATVSTKGLQVFRILTLAAVGMAALLALFPPVGHDQLWCLYVAQRMLAGARLYGPELFESNPPLIMWGSLVLAHGSALTHIPITVLFKCAVAVIELLSAWLSLRILRSLYPEMKANAQWALAFAYIAIFAVMPARDFGQRDHLLAVLCLPYVLAAALDAGLPRGMRVLIGLGAAIGICLKPHHILLVVAVEILRVIRWKKLGAEPLVMLTVGIGYVAAVMRVTPEYLAQVVPLLHDVYWAIGHLSLPQLVGEAVQLHLLAAVVLFLYLRGWRERKPLETVLIAAAVASTMAYYLQGTGWYYQQIPALSFFAAVLALQLIGYVALLRVTQAAVAGTAALSVLALGLTAYFTGYPFIPSRSFPIDAPDESFFTNLAPGTPVAILTTSVDDTVMPVAKYHLLWAQRTNNLWILPALLRNENGPKPLKVIAPARLAELEATQHRFMVEDLNRWHPALILVNRCQDPKVECQVIEDRHDDLLAWFSRDPAFRATFASYRYVGSKGDFDAYTLSAEK